MELWNPTKEWEGQDAFLVGGGPSLRSFDFNLLKERNTIGCNDAFRLGKDVIQICLFSDAPWFHSNKWELESFGGRVVSTSFKLKDLKIPWMQRMDRIGNGIAEGSTVSLNYSTGASAINLAVTLGAKRIYLLGYDLSRGADGKSHWHRHERKPTSDTAFQRFIKGFSQLDSALKQYPEVKVFNVTDGGSRLPFFERISFAQFAEVLK